ncbi:NADH:flavin oxidoreductase/NADH oxidase [Agrobacterium tumefaciens]|uniref:NADH:flavin oxidoreductase/NADH oxidase n=1 Tax=Agrobacterium tumefaciens TaxID=358 RepID=UPI001572B2EF|nr:NADH:flavin oxidoreductase/NADH oxidase [Agrobacterium tumefaciens]NSZ03179.1 NADH:flavin oxidoreductase/NADH oxidase [Agrobacterium tumefaciens]NSZ39794.1 NADH:flavin oxidoreductase/NADH oxidase [Agrobacterium tumefaciens]NTB26752.1 NADH:flavin oxidoreductase/NADH oxidase [Agrobacterium tumefaciens]NTB31854.1 NADH:flavin oxidoreductase/NADH oxidase [Agrobacterium tumefaciens]NTB34299.1 NADH:flavin oxidoreductase/NADH oxidase [Agrobacterium tumefaciens]
MPKLFTTFSLKDVTLRNRVAVPPMCQYSAVDGFTTDWHEAHYAGIARGGAGLVIVEATGVSPEGRITPGCTGIWNDAHIEGLSRIAGAIKAAGAVPGIQIAHAGRKASANRPWEGDDHIRKGDPRGWDTIAPSATAFGGGLSKVPKEMTLEDITRVKADFAEAARRAREAGFEWLELHFAHGYLAQSFFSREANQRTDSYGGDFGGRSRFLLETLAAVRAIWPENLPLTARFGVIEYNGHDEETLAESIQLAKAFRGGGLDLLNVSIGFSTMSGKTPWGPAFLAPIAQRVRKETDMPVASSWCIDGPTDAERAVATGQMDLIMIGRAHLANPHYTFTLAKNLGVERPEWTTLPSQYAYWLSRYRGAGTGSAQ